MTESFFNIDGQLRTLAAQAEADCGEAFARIEETCAFNEEKVLSAFARQRVSEVHFKGSTGYGYDDLGRETLDRVPARTFSGARTRWCATILYRAPMR